MIEKGLKVGDTFTDNHLLYKIIDIDANGNYISSLVGKAGEGVETPKKKVAEKVAPKKKIAKEEVMKGV